MMRAILAALLLCVLALPAQAAHGHHHRIAAHWRVQHGFAPRVHFAYRGALSPACQQARALGGPCGCFASEHFFGRSVRNLWLANAWLHFPRSAPAPGTAAVTPGRHVAAVVAAAPGRVLLRDSWATHWASTRGLVFVNPHAGGRA